MKRILVNCFALAFLVSCGRDPHWRTISPSGLKGQFNDIVFATDSTGWMAGSGMETPSRDEKAVIYKTVDGGNTWTPSYAGRGSAQLITHINDTLFCIKRVVNYDSHGDMNSVLLKSVDAGRNWTKIFELPGLTKQMSFSNAYTGCLITEDTESNTGDWKLLKTSNGGLTWSPMRLVSNVQSGILINSSFFINQYGGNALLVVDLEKDTLISEAFPNNFNSQLILKDNNSGIWVVGNDSHDFVLLKREMPGSFSRIEFDMIRGAKPFDFYTHVDIRDNVIKIVTGDGGTIIGVSKRFFISRDGGKIWDEEEMPFDLMVEPLTFDGGKVWSYNGTGLQVRDDRY